MLRGGPIRRSNPLGLPPPHQNPRDPPGSPSESSDATYDRRGGGMVVRSAGDFSGVATGRLVFLSGRGYLITCSTNRPAVSASTSRPSLAHNASLNSSTSMGPV
jgi:hypothetical protein